jgi:hypothetical protein
MKYLKDLRIYLAIIICLSIVHVLHFNFICDDAFISFRYAQNLNEGFGLVWNINENPVEGYTNFLWIILISVLMKIGFEPIITSKVLGVFFGSCSIILSYLFSEIILQRKSPLNLLAPAFLAFSGPFAAWGTGGLETQMFTFLILAGVIVYLYEIKNDVNIPTSAILFALASFTRPEGVLIFCITTLHYFFYILRSKKNFFRKPFFWFITFIIIYGIYSYWRYFYFGYIFPNTYYAKTGGGVHQILRGLKYFGNFIVFSSWAFLIVIGLFPIFKLLRSSTVYLMMIIFAYTSYIIIIGGDFLGMFRFFVPILPLMAIVAQESFINLNQWIKRSVSNDFIKKIAFTFCSVFLILLIGGGVRLSFNSDEYNRIQFHQVVVNDQTAVGEWLYRNALPNESFAAIAIGAISYYSKLTSIDRLGITDSNIAHTKMEHMGKGLAGHEKRNFGYILARKPTYFFGPLKVPLHTPYVPDPKEIRKFKQLYKRFKMGLNLKLKTAEIVYKLRGST